LLNHHQDIKMYISQLALASILASFPLSASGITSAAFSYDPDADNGPDHWKDLDIGGNQCDGSSNSPIAVETHGCDRYENYKMVVSSSNGSV
jgi:carbonic anhydrase